MNIINKVTGQFSQVITYDLTTGDITGFNPIGNVNLGPVSNLSITGGTAGQVLATDGAGGLSFVTSSGSYSNTDVSNYLDGNIATNIIPATATQSLGSLANPWNELFISGNTIYVAGVPLSLGANTALEFNGVPLVQSTGDTNIDTTGNIQAAEITANGNIVANSGYFFIGDGGLLSNVGGGGSYGNADVALYLPTYTGNLAGGNAAITQQVTAGSFAGDGGNLSNITAANITGTVAEATVASSANSVAGANVSGEVAFAAAANSVAGANVSGEVAFAAAANSVAGANVSGTVASATVAASANSVAGANVTGTVASATVAASANSVAGANVIGEVTFAATANTVAGANVTGIVANATFATTAAEATNAITATVATTAHNVAGANVTGAVAFATTANTVAGANVTGAVANANYAAYAGNVTIAAQPNITSVGTLTTLAVSGNLSAGNTAAGNLLTANFITGTLTTAAQPNVTSVGTLTSLTVTGNTNVGGNLVTDSVISNTGTLTLSASGANQNVALAPTGTGVVDVNSTRVTELATPVNATDAATKGYVDSVAEGLNVKEGCVAATPADLATLTGDIVSYNNGTAGVGATLTLDTALTTLDGVTLANGDRILVKSEASTEWNGIYVWATGGTTLTRSTDYDTPADISAGSFVFISSGTLYAGTGWVETDVVTTIGTDPIDFTQFSGAGSYTAGAGLTLAGTQFSVTDTTVTAGTYGNASQTTTFTVNGRGQLTAASQQAVVANAETLTGTSLKNTVLTSNLTSVGTLVGLVINGNLEITQSAQIEGNAAVLGNLFAAQFIGNGSQLTGINYANIVDAYGNANVSTYLASGTDTAGYGTTGNIDAANVSAAGMVSTPMVEGDTTNGLILSAGADYTANLQYAQIRQGADTNDIFLTTGDNTVDNLYLGHDFHHVVIANTGAVTVATRNDTLSENYSWVFGNTGTLTVNGGMDIYSSGLLQALDAELRLTARIDSNLDTPIINSIENTGTEVSTTTLTGNAFTIALQLAGTPQSWQFDTAGNLTLPANTFAVNYANGDPVEFSNYSNTDVSTYLASGINTDIITSGTIVATEFAGGGSQLSGITGSNVTGQVANALVSATVYEAAQPNITSVGTLDDLTVNSSNTVSITGGNTTSIVLDSANGYVSINQNANIDIFGNITTPSDVTAFNMFAETMIADVMGNSTTVLFGDGANITGLPAGYANSDVANLLASGTLTSNIVTSGNIFGGYINGDGSGLTLLTGSEVTGEVTFAATANTVAGANVTGAVTYAATANAVAGANVSGTVASATVAASANSVAVANVSGIGNIATINLNGSTTQVLAGNGAWITPAPGYGNANVATYLASNANVVITTTGNITTTANASANNFVAGNNVVVSGTAGTGNIVGANNVSAINFIASGNLAVAGNTDLGAVGNVTITGGTTGQVLTTDGAGDLSWTTVSSGGSYGDSNVVTLLGAFGSNSVTTTGNITAGNLVLTGSITKAPGSSIQLNSNNFTVGINSAFNVAISSEEDAGYVALGTGSFAGGTQTISIGYLSQATAGGANSISVGTKAGQFSPGANSITIGQFAGAGSFAGTKLGANSIAIGYGAANGGSAANVIVLNATGANFTPSTSQASSFYVNPVRNDTGNTTNVVYYNTTTKEVTYGPGVAGYANSDVANYLASNANVVITTTGNITTTANIAATGNISANGNIIVNGTIGTGNISGANNISGLTVLASNAILVGTTVTTLPNTVARFGSNANSYTQITFQNLSTGTDATSDIVLTTDNGSDTVNFADFGIINSAYDPNTPTNSLGNVVFASDAYLYAQGNVGNTAQSGGNLVLGATVSTKNVKIFAGGNTNAFVTATFTSTAANLKALIVQGTSNLGAVGNVTITGGTAGQVLTTNGSNVLSWTTVSGGGGGSIISNGTSNVSIAASNGNITMAVGGTPAFRLSLTDNSITIGTNARANTTISTSKAIAIGQEAAFTDQSSFGVAIGYQAGYTTQGSEATAVGTSAGYNIQAAAAVGVGAYAGYTGQGASAVAVGTEAGNSFQGTNAVALGRRAGFASQGANSIAIGYQAGYTSQAAGTIIINATGANLNSTQANSFYVAPVRNDTGNVTNVVYYNTTTKEVTYGPAAGGGSTGIDRSVITGNVTLTLAQAGTFLYSTATAAQTVTIPTNASVAFPIGTTINVVLNGAGSVALTPDSGVSLYLAGNSTSATRTVSPYGLATLLQVDTDVWFVNGTGVY